MEGSRNPRPLSFLFCDNCDNGQPFFLSRPFILESKAITNKIIANNLAD